VKKLFKVFLTLVFVLSLVPQHTSAAPAWQGAACEQDVVVQADDWLSKLSDKFYGDVLAFPAIVQATNQQNAADDSYARIVNPDIIEAGWKLCVPSGADAVAMLGSQSAPVAGAPAELANVSYGNFNPNYASNLLTELSDHFGWLQEGGVANQEVAFIDQSQIFPAIIGGSLHIASQDTDAVAGANLAGEPLLMIAIYRDKEPWIVAFREGVDINNLEGVQCSAGGAGGRNEFNAKEMIKRQGGDPDQVEWVPIRGGSDARVNAFVEGQIDCVNHFDRHRALVAEANGVLIYDDLENVPQDGFVVHRSFAEQNPRTVINYLKAFIQARDYFKDPNNKDEIIEIMRSREYEIPQAFVDQYERAQTIIGDDGYFDPVAMDTLIADAVRVGNLEQSIDWREFIDLSYLNQAYTELGMADRIKDPDAPAQPAAAASGGPISIGVSLPLSGRFSEPGTAAQRGYEVWATMVNEAGGLLGRPVELTILDNNSDQDTAVGDYEKLITVDEVDLVVGPFSSFLVIPTSEVAARYGYAFVEPAGGAPDVFNRGLTNLFFAQPGGSTAQGQAFAKYVLSLPEGTRPQTFAIVSQDDPFTLGVMDAVREGLTAGGVELVFDETYAPETTDFSAIAIQVADLDPDLVAGGTILEDAVGQVRSYQEAGYQPRGTFFTTGPSLPGPFREGLGSATEGIMSAISWYYATPSYQNQEMAAKYVEMFGGEPAEVAEDTANAFTVGQVLQQAVENIQSIDNAALIEELHRGTYQTVVGPLSFDASGKPLGDYMLLQWQGDNFNIVAPASSAQSDPVWPKPAW
jgi:branched-chain amino acid transport system substrate-binding protein